VATINVPDKNEPVPGNKTIRFKSGMASKVYSEDFPYQAGDSLFLHKSCHSLAMQMIAETALGAPEYVYSCVNFILLKEIAEQISGMSLDQFLKKEFYEPMGLQNLTYLPLRNHNADRIAPTVRFDSFRNNASKAMYTILQLHFWEIFREMPAFLVMPVTCCSFIKCAERWQSMEKDISVKQHADCLSTVLHQTDCTDLDLQNPHQTNQLRIPAELQPQWLWWDIPVTPELAFGLTPKTT
jgi:hypothetical protein